MTQVLGKMNAIKISNYKSCSANDHLSVSQQCHPLGQTEYESPSLHLMTEEDSVSKALCFVMTDSPETM